MMNINKDRITKVFNTLDNALSTVINDEDKPTYLEIFLALEALRLKLLHYYVSFIINAIDIDRCNNNNNNNNNKGCLKDKDIGKERCKDYIG